MSECTEKRRGRKTEPRCSRHVRLYSETMRRARGVVSQRHILAVAMVLALPAHLHETQESGIKTPPKERAQTNRALQSGPQGATLSLKALLSKAMLFEELPSDHPKNKMNAQEKEKSIYFCCRSQLVMPQKPRKRGSTTGSRAMT